LADVTIQYSNLAVKIKRIPALSPGNKRCAQLFARRLNGQAVESIPRDLPVTT
jgi:hypothetical protein